MILVDLVKLVILVILVNLVNLANLLECKDMARICEAEFAVIKFLSG